ncbi:MAG: hypothetical protein GYA14_07770 [Ignavibacteria bacterium]|nr:hypothetical protein [Ignavibacteria bacterium]
MLISIFLGFILILQAFLEIIPIFGEGFKSWLGAIVITSLFSISGVIKGAADWLFGFGGVISLINEWGIIKLIVIILLLVILAFGIKKILHIIRHEEKKGENYMAGVEIYKQKQKSKIEGS